MSADDEDPEMRPSYDFSKGVRGVYASRYSRGWSFVEEIGIGIPNPRAAVRMLIPEDLPPEVRARIEKALDELEAAEHVKPKE